MDLRSSETLGILLAERNSSHVVTPLFQRDVSVPWPIPGIWTNVCSSIHAAIVRWVIQDTGGVAENSEKVVMPQAHITLRDEGVQTQ